MRPDAPSPRLATLLSRLSDESLTAEETAELEDILLHDSEAREYYRWHAAVHVGLAERAGTRKFEPRNIVRPSFGKRLLAIANYNNDISEYWEFSNQGFAPIDDTNEAYKLGVNYIIYGLTH